VTKPYLLIDVDGVLVPFGSELPPDGYEAVDIDGFDRWLNPAHGRWLNDLGVSYELVWATAWGRDAPEVLGPILGLPDMPVIEFGIGGSGETWKLDDVARFVGDRPLAWIDDDLHDDAWEWAGERREATLLICTDPAVGFIRAHVADLEEFAEAVRRRRRPDRLSWDDRDQLLTEVAMGESEEQSKVPSTPESRALRRTLEAEVGEMRERGVMPEHPKA
jgi:hypothetical protein